MIIEYGKVRAGDTVSITARVEAVKGAQVQVRFARPLRGAVNWIDDRYIATHTPQQLKPEDWVYVRGREYPKDKKGVAEPHQIIAVEGDEAWVRNIGLVNVKDLTLAEIG